MANVIELSDIEKSYRIGNDEYPILKGVNLNIEHGEFVALMSPSGSGKSTLINIVGCLDRASRGKFLFLGEDVSQASGDKLSQIRREELGFIFQSFNLIGRISVLKNVEVPMIFSEIPREQRRARALELLKSVGSRASDQLQPSQYFGR